MKKLLIVFLCIFSLVLLGCADSGIRVRPITDQPQDCIDKEDYPNSQILKVIDKPCTAYRIFATVAKQGIVLDQYNAKEFERYAENSKELLRVGLTGAQIKNYVMSMVIDVNRILGGTMIVMTDLLLEFDDNLILEIDDVRLMVLAIDNMVKEVKATAAWHDMLSQAYPDKILLIRF